ncbi:prepilin-type cleavage/methylation domain-containing protein [Virgibacillus phasianinus]|uniref:Prepilin-type cleavage/methylation domain-containing protein n=1 Tax=Virgibacillus phasianinus TaxID=2017483 RepID=A0A220U4X8_9BACI|nr:prepilin-type N-terminal cleavage/methylation domain-containing protein [Virgibacillus phasianinus]ASK62966.1 prepilin-type cleavage/methylation domain-containing protein [Virgibacillus phasianinus]
MLERLKKKIKKENGFTLVELLAVIAILAIIVAIAVPTIGNVIGDSEAKANDASKELFENAARLAHASGYEPTDGAAYTLTELNTKGFLDEDPSDKFSGTVVVTTVTDGGTKYEYKETE